MANQPLNQNLKFDTEMRVTAPFDSSSQLLGTLQNRPVIMFIKNQSTVDAFFSDNETDTIGMTMVPGESIVLDCRANHGNAVDMGFQIGTSFFVVGTGGTGDFVVSILYAK